MTGRVLPIGGIKEKALAARRSDVKTLLFPQGNKKDWDELKGTIHVPGLMTKVLSAVTIYTARPCVVDLPTWLHCGVLRPCDLSMLVSQ